MQSPSRDGGEAKQYGLENVLKLKRQLQAAQEAALKYYAGTAIGARAVEVLLKLDREATCQK